MSLRAQVERCNGALRDARDTETLLSARDAKIRKAEAEALGSRTLEELERERSRTQSHDAAAAKASQAELSKLRAQCEDTEQRRLCTERELQAVQLECEEGREAARSASSKMEALRDELRAARGAREGDASELRSLEIPCELEAEPTTARGSEGGGRQGRGNGCRSTSRRGISAAHASTKVHHDSRGAAEGAREGGESLGGGTAFSAPDALEGSSRTSCD